jgi:hypothetical protein
MEGFLQYGVYRNTYYLVRRVEYNFSSFVDDNVIRHLPINNVELEK